MNNKKRVSITGQFSIPYILRKIKNKEIYGYIYRDKREGILEGSLEDIDFIIQKHNQRKFSRLKRLNARNIEYVGDIKNFYIINHIDDIKIRAYIKIFGILKNVSYETTALRFAKDLNITGWIKNNDDDIIDTTIEGSINNIKKFIDILKRGTPKSVIHNMDITYQKYINEFKKFSIIR